MTGELDPILRSQVEMAEALRQAGWLETDDVGRFVLSGALQDLMQPDESGQTDMAAAVELAPGLSEREQWLDTTLAAAVVEHGLEFTTDTKYNLAKKLRSNDISTIRDVLVVGRAGIGAIPDLGLEAEPNLEVLLSGDGQDYQWIVVPTIAEILELTPKGLSQVTSYVLRCSVDLKSRPPMVLNLPPTVQAILDMRIDFPEDDGTGPGTLLFYNDWKTNQALAREFAKLYEIARKRRANML